MRATFAAPLTAALAALAGCGTQPIAKPDAHIRQAEDKPAPAPSSIPAPVRAAPMPPPPGAKASELRYSVVVANQPVREVLLAMARESKANFDIHPGVEGSVTLNAIDQTLQQILDRITRQMAVRYEVHGQTITVMPDLPYLKNYKVNYVNMSRETTETNSIATQVISGAIGTTQSGSSSDNNSTLRITSVARNRFWETLEANIKDILKEADKRVELGGTTAAGTERAASQVTASGTGAAASGPAGVAGAGNQAVEGTAARGSQQTATRFFFEPATPVIVSPETGIISVRASSRQHEKVAEFLEQIGASASRQVVIEATIVEVSLSDRYQSGVDWSALAVDGLGYSVIQSFAGGVVNLTNPAGPPISIGYSNPSSGSGTLTSTVKLLSQFGTTRVLSSPLLMVLNNQTATLKVVDNRVYFNIKAETINTANVGSTTTFTTTQNVVPVGLIMHITPQISEQDEVILNVRPTVTSITGTVDDPNPALRGTLTQPAIPNKIPETRTREMQSVLKVTSGRTAILGGLMLDSFEGARDGVPIASRIPIFGDLFSYRNDRAIRSELVIFVRPIVVRDPSVDTDLAAYRRFLPNNDFFKGTQGPFPEFEESLGRLERGELGEPPPTSPPVPEPTPGPKP